MTHSEHIEASRKVQQERNKKIAMESQRRLNEQMRLLHEEIAKYKRDAMGHLINPTGGCE